MSALRRLDRHISVAAGAGLLLPLVLVVGVPRPAQALLGTALLAFVPGYALVRLLPTHDGVMTALLSVAASLALTAAVSTTLLYLGVWSWQYCAVVAGAVTVGACLARARMERSG